MGRVFLLTFLGCCALLTAPLARGIAGTLTGSFMPIAPGANINLTANGALDWVHWGLDWDDSVNRKAIQQPQQPQIGNFTALGPATYGTYVYQFSDNYNGYSWNNGTPNPAVTNTTTGVWVYNDDPFGTGFKFSVPADTSLKTLRVYVGAFNARGRLIASLSDASAPNYTNTSLVNFSNGPAGVYTINFAAASSKQSLTISWTLTNALGEIPNVTLQAATLASGPAGAPPLIRLLNPVQVGNAFIFSLATQSNRIYQVECANAFGPNSWQVIGNFTGNGAVMTCTNLKAPGPPRLYRVSTQ